MTSPDDRRLREGLRRGDESVLAELLQEYWAPVVRFVRTILGDTDIAEDVAQETFVRLWTARERWRGEGALAPLLYRIARNAALDERKGRRRIGPIDAEPHVAIPTYEHPDAALETRDLERAIRRAVDALPPKRREIFLLARATDLTYAQIAEALGVSPQTVANQMSRALKDLREALPK